MLKSLLGAASLLGLVSVVGCAQPPVEVEEQRGTSSRQVASGFDTAQARRDLDALEAKANNCEYFDQDDLDKLGKYTGMVNFTFEAYVSFKCSVEEGQIVVGEAAVEHRTGWSSEDGAFTEQAIETTAAIEIPVKLVNVSGAVTSSITARQTATEMRHEQSVSASVAVSKDFGVAEGTASVSYDGESATVAGGVSVPLVIKTTDCIGEESVGLTVSLSAAHVDTAPRAIAERAAKIQLQNVGNLDFYNAVGYFYTASPEARDQAVAACCNREKTCD